MEFTCSFPPGPSSVEWAQHAEALGYGRVYLHDSPALYWDVWATLASASWNDYEPADGAFRLMQFGTANLSLLIGLAAAVDFYNSVGSDRIEKRVLELSNRLRDGLKTINRARIYSPTHPAMTCGITTWGIDGITGTRLMDELWSRRKLRVRAVDENSVRQSSHFYNMPEEIDATLEIARTLTRAA